jgi:hypothetical protein
MHVHDGLGQATRMYWCFLLLLAREPRARRHDHARLAAHVRVLAAPLNNAKLVDA